MAKGKKYSTAGAGSALDDLRGYLRAKEPSMREKAYAWRTAIGLQKVDGLTPSDYLIETAKKNIEGEITLAESRKLIEGRERLVFSQCARAGELHESAARRTSDAGLS